MAKIYGDTGPAERKFGPPKNVSPRINFFKKMCRPVNLFSKKHNSPQGFQLRGGQGGSTRGQIFFVILETSGVSAKLGMANESTHSVEKFKGIYRGVGGFSKPGNQIQKKVPPLRNAKMKTLFCGTNFCDCLI